MNIGASVAGQAAKEMLWGAVLLVGAGAYLWWAMTTTINAFSGTPRGYARGYCRALDASAVADSLCVRGDSIVAHIKEAK